MAVNRIYYALSNVMYWSENAWVSVPGAVQSAGISSTVNIESFSSFGSLYTSTAIQDADFEITIEALLTATGSSLLTLMSNQTDTADRLLGFNSMDPDKVIRIALVYITPATSSTGTNAKHSLTMDCVPSSYSMNMGLEGGVVESMTFQNAGNSILANNNVGTPYTSVTNVSLDNVLSRANFAGFEFKPSIGDNFSATNVQSVSCSMDFSTEKLNALGSSMPIAKYATYPIETSMEVEEHIDPAFNMFSSPVSVGVTTQAGEVQGLRDIYYSPMIKIWGQNNVGCSSGGQTPTTTYRHGWQAGCSRLTGRSQSGGDVGGGNATVTSTFTGYNNLGYIASTTPFTSVTTLPPAYIPDHIANGGGVNASTSPSDANSFTLPTTPSPSGNYMQFDTGDFNTDPWNDGMGEINTKQKQF